MTLASYPEKAISYLYEVGVQGGIRRAAELSGVNASAISRQIAALERAMQLPLLERRGRNVVLTEAGKLLAEDYAQTCQRRKKLAQQLQDMRHMRGGSVTLRIGQGMVEDVVNHVLRDFAVAYPGVFVELSSGDMETSVALISRGEVDMAVGFGTTGPAGLKCLSYQRGPICAIVTPDHPIAGLEKVSIAQLTAYRLIGMSGTFGLQHYVQAMFNGEGLSFSPAFSCNLFSSAIALSQAGLGVAFMTAQAVSPSLLQSTLVAVPVDHRIARESQCHLLRSADRRFTPAASYLWQLLSNWFRGQGK